MDATEWGHGHMPESLLVDDESSPPIYVFRVGPYADGVSLYAPIGPDGLTEKIDVDAVEDTDDVAGLRRIVEQKPRRELVCGPELAVAARAFDLKCVEELPALIEGTRIELALDIAQGGGLTLLGDPRSLLRLLTACGELIESRWLSRWPAQYSFEVELRGDRTDVFSGWIADGPAPTITLVRRSEDAKVLAISSEEERVQCLATLDHLAMSLVTPPAFVLEPLEAFYGITVMPRFQKLEHGQRELPTDEDVLRMAGIVAAIAQLDRFDDLGCAETETPRRKVRTFITVGLPYSFVHLPA